jgi:hypothetical protein
MCTTRVSAIVTGMVLTLSYCFMICLSSDCVRVLQQQQQNTDCVVLVREGEGERKRRLLSP